MKLSLATSLLALLALPVLASVPACSAAHDDGPYADEVVAPVDFYASDAREYWVTGASTVTIEPSLASATAAKKLARAKELAQLKNVALSWFLNTYLTDKEDTDTNKAYGGFSALTRFASEEDGAIAAVDATTFSFTYKVQVAGSKTLIKKLPGSGGDDGKTFTLATGKVSNDDLARLETNHEWYRDAPWDSFDPKKLGADQIENVAMTITPQPASTDSWLAYDRLVDDGEISVAVHFGWDYWSRYDIKSSRTLYSWLTSRGFASPTGSYDEYDRTSGPLTKTITANKKPVTVKVWIFHPGDPANHVLGPDPDTDAGGKVLEKDMRESLKTREVIVFDGHSGPLYGFALADWRKTDEGDFDDSKIPGAEMLDGYQIVLANGCDTYDLGQAFWKNPAKADHKGINVITTTNFSNASIESSVERLVDALSNQKSGKLVPAKVSALTSGLDDDQGYGFDTMYGVHGVDANPKYDPFADKSTACQPCSTTADCGGDGNRCTKVGTKKVCTYGCIDDSGCDAGYTCRTITSGGRAVARQCVPQGLRCD